MNESSAAADPISPRERRQCSRCGAYCRNEDEECRYCQRNFSRSGRPLKAGQFSLATLLGAMTGVAVWLGLYLFSPPLAIGIGLFCGAAIGRMLVVEAMHSGEHRSAAPLWLSFVVSLAIVFWTAALFFLVFGLGCFASVSLLSAGGGRPIPDYPLWPIALGFLLALTLSCVLLWSTRDLPN